MTGFFSIYGFFHKGSQSFACSTSLKARSHAQSLQGVGLRGVPEKQECL